MYVEACIPVFEFFEVPDNHDVIIITLKVFKILTIDG
jgi:hypothetical protein